MIGSLAIRILISTEIHTVPPPNKNLSEHCARSRGLHALHLFVRLHNVNVHFMNQFLSQNA